MCINLTSTFLRQIHWKAWALCYEVMLYNSEFLVLVMALTCCWLCMKQANFRIKVGLGQNPLLIERSTEQTEKHSNTMWKMRHLIHKMNGSDGIPSTSFIATPQKFLLSSITLLTSSEKNLVLFFSLCTLLLCSVDCMERKKFPVPSYSFQEKNWIPSDLQSPVY